MRIYTRQGDKGSRDWPMHLAKDDKRVETYGAIDELNSK
jgi:cob(I)alamin adenosyltransferase